MNATLVQVEAAQFRQAFSRLASGTSIVTLMDAQGVKMGFTATSVTSVSMDPPLLLVCVNQNSRTIAPFQAGTPFVVNFLAGSQQSLAMQFASLSADKFANAQYSISENGGLHLNEVLTSIECIPHQLYPSGDHWIVVGRVSEIRIGGDQKPLVYFRQQFI